MVSFLTKPIIEQELIQSLNKAKEKLSYDAHLLRQIEELESLKKNNLILIKESIFNKLLRESHLTQTFKERVREVGINLDYQYFQMAIIDVDSKTQDIELELIKLTKSLENTNDFSFDFTIKNEQLILLFKSNNQNMSGFIERSIKHLILSNKRFNNTLFNCGLSLSFQDGNFKRAYDQAKRALALRKLYINEDGIYTYESYPQTQSLRIDDAYLKDFIYALEFSTLSDTLALLDRLLDAWYAKDNQALYYFMTSSLLNEMFKTTNKDELLKEIGSINTYYQTLLETKSLHSLKEALYALSKHIKALNKSERLKTSAHNTNKILTYIKHNFKDPNLNMDQVSYNVNLSSSYTSLLLKEENTSFTKYLTEQRLEYAKSLILSSNLKIMDKHRGHKNIYGDTKLSNKGSLLFIALSSLLLVFLLVFAIVTSL